jgi:LPXTG-motif cell wall-anchored protein
VSPIVVDQPAPTTPTTVAVLPTSLPVTGSGSTVLVLAGILCLMLGGGLIFMGRRQPAEA